MPHKKLLIVEDEDAMARVLCNKFSKSGFEVQRSANGTEAMEVLQKEQVDLVLLDLFMPGKDGFVVLSEKAQTKNAATPVFVLTNLGQEEIFKRARELGAAECFVKSRTSLQDLVAKIEERLKAE